MNTIKTRIEHIRNAVWAVITEDGIAVYPDSEDAVSAVLTGSVTETPEDAKWYATHGPWHPCEELTDRVNRKFFSSPS